MYIAAGKLRLKDFRANELEAARRKAQTSGLPEDAQAANDLAAQADRFEKKIHDLELTRNVSLQMAPQIRMLQNSNQLMAEKIQSSLVNTMPAVESQWLRLAAHTQEAMEAQRAVTDSQTSCCATTPTAAPGHRGDRQGIRAGSWTSKRCR
jgi:uncharacterized protein YaaN involved in tellurite resistance